jgi:hypothetical protein
MIMLNALLQAKNNNAMVQMFTDATNLESFIVGVPIEVDDEFVALLESTKTGEADGVSVRRTSRIIILEIETKYITYLSREGNCGALAAEYRRAYDFKDFQSVLTLAKEMKQSIRIELEDGSFESGVVVDFDVDDVALRTCDPLSVFSGVSIIRLESVESLKIFGHRNSIDELVATKRAD